ncbi:Splicing factor 45 [Coemansia sp. RSA 1199]|nr:Splicing factor 45 [Coemansia sp. RSA 1199]
MSLFGDLPPPADLDSGDTNKDKQTEVKGEQLEAKSSPKGTRSWARPDLVPNLRRPKTPARPRNSASLLKNSVSLIPTWEAAATAGEKPRVDPQAGKKAVPKTLAEYMPPTTKPGKFDPHAEYNPALPNTYQLYKQWVEEQHTMSHEPHFSEDEHDTDESSDERNAGEPSEYILLTNMADEIDEDLEHETREECRVFGDVVQCTAALVDVDDPYERVQVTVQFADVQAAVRAQHALDRRFFDGRHISVTFHHPASA